MLRLDFSYADLRLPTLWDKTRRASISGVQEKVQLRRVRGGYEIVESGGDAILKPAPRHSAARLKEDIPANEYLTMRIAAKHFGVVTAKCELVEFCDGELAYLVQRFDRRDGLPIRQEDFCQLSGRTAATHGDNYKYDASYEELAGLVRKFCPSAAIENPKVFFIILFNYVFSNGDAHLKNFSLFQSPQGDYILTPAYDLLNTSIHFPNEPSATGLDFFADGHCTAQYEELGFYSLPDFVELGKSFGVSADEVRKWASAFSQRKDAVKAEILASLLSQEAKDRYLARYEDRLKALEI